MNQDSMTSGWYFAKAGGQAGSETGPFEWEQLYQLARNGTVQPDDLVWNPKLPRGVAARLVPGLFQGLQASPTPVQKVWVDQAPEPAVPEPQTPNVADAPAPQPPQPAETALLDDFADLGSTKEPAEEPVEGSAPRRHRQRERAAADKQSNRLPLLVVLLVFVVAAAGVASYFLYFRV